MGLFRILSSIVFLGIFIRPIGLSFYNFNFSLTVAVFLVVVFPRLLFNREHWNRWKFYYVSLLLGVLVGITSKLMGYYTSNVTVLRIFRWSYYLSVFPFFDAILANMIKTRRDFDARGYLVFNTIVFSVSALISFFGYADGTVLYSPENFGIDVAANKSAATSYSLIYGISYSNLVFVPVAISVMYVRDKPFWFRILLYTIVIFAVFITLKRIAIVSLLISLFLVYRQEKYSTKLVLVLFLFIAAFTQSGTLGVLLARFSDAFTLFHGGDIVDSSTQIRSDRLAFAWNAFRSSPIIGNGSGAYVYIHNGFLEVLSNLGFLGIPILYKFCKPVIYYYKLSKSAKNWAIGYSLLLVTVFSFETAINRVEILYFMAFFYSLVINSNMYDIDNNSHI